MKNKKTENRPASAVTVSVPAEGVVIPSEFAPIPGMNNVTLAAAAIVAQKNPNIVKSAVEFRDAYNRAGEKFFGIASSLREAKLVKKEATMLLHALGFSPSRTSEMIRLSSVSDEIWNQYSAQKVGFRAALQLENGEKDAQEAGEDSTGGKKRNVAKIYPVASQVKHLLEGLAEKDFPMKNGKRTEYSHTVELGEGRFLHVTIFSDKE